MSLSFQLEAYNHKLRGKTGRFIAEFAKITGDMDGTKFAPTQV